MAVGTFKLMYGSRVEGVVSNDLYLGGQLNFVYIYVYIYDYVCIYIYIYRYTYMYIYNYMLFHSSEHVIRNI